MQATKAMPTEPKIGRGNLKFYIPIHGIGIETLIVYGGPFHLKPRGMFGVCLKERFEGDSELDIHMPIEDFSVPHDDVLVRQVLGEMIRLGLDGHHPYVGCAAGQGRTGIMLSLLVKAMGVTETPVEFVRQHYYPHAVETTEQYDYVKNFDVSGIVEKAIEEHLRENNMLLDHQPAKVPDAEMVDVAPPEDQTAPLHGPSNWKGLWSNIKAMLAKFNFF